MEATGLEISRNAHAREVVTHIVRRLMREVGWPTDLIALFSFLLNKQVLIVCDGPEIMPETGGRGTRQTVVIFLKYSLLESGDWASKISSSHGGKRNIHF